ncbi:Molybdopterin-binding protein [Corynebacterium kutscheri]|uniref:DNA-binding protein, excisionase family n=1 Tax=Corynebacterium kutscheri TaxID=35755 RepID=A0A0F6R1B9_9CORY|nr:TOBE domain-containing protein [Corynebacterium kutscheri]AKE42237.1 DNA-binding protein, excisionase family [Corynebacterium kutscheri]VEH05701.1 Molybdopterin-binding protein [Corynebacterium kutscheri]VEH10580.1 Molybdopterin-binding protein [Corynebacterium kutscheri]VEH81597.1 Molybdopterin-binding protein [Corynebacterium kutscheri]
MTYLRISQAAALLGVSDDTLRRWIDAGRISASHDDSGRAVINNKDLAQLAVELADDQLEIFSPKDSLKSARNSLTGIVTKVISDKVMSQVEMQCGRYRLVSLISTEAVQELGIEVGSVSTAVVKATNVSIERSK